MKSVFSAILIFSAIMIMSVSCTDNSRSDNEPAIALVTEETTVYSSVSSPAAVTSVSSVTSAVSSVRTSCGSSGIPVSHPDYAAAEVSMLEAVGNPDYNGEIWIPYVGWTEVNLNKTMYPVSQCIGYEFALPEAAPVMRYDAGIALEVIARTSTGYYRLRGDYYIPCDFLDTIIHDGADPAAATSCEIVTVPVSSYTVSKPQSITSVTEEDEDEYDYEYDYGYNYEYDYDYEY